MLNAAFYITISLFIFVCIFMILLILIQKGRGGGLASAFGGAGGNTAFGSKTGDVLTWTTSVVFGIFLILAVALNLLANKRATSRSTLVAPAVPAAIPTAPLDISNTAVPPGGPLPTTAPAK
jgi:preprotein translocase subunit SecG